MRSEFNEELARLARASHGLIHGDAASQVGIARQYLHERVAAGLLEQVDHAIFRINGVPVSWHQRALCAVWTQGPEALLSHRAAAQLHRLDGVARAPLDVLAPRWQRRSRRDGVRTHETLVLPTTDATVVEGIPCTSVVRTVLDLPAVLHERRCDQAMEDALRRGLCTIEQLANRFTQLARRGRRGTRVGRLLIEKRLGRNVPTASEFERRMLELIEEAGLPQPVGQFVVALRDTRVYLDLAWPDQQVAVECDGVFHHGSNVSLPWDDDRQNELVLMGWLVLRFTWKQVTEHPELVVRQICNALRQRR